MSTLLGDSDALKTQGAASARVLADARRSYSEVVDDSFLEAWSHRAVDELWSESIKVKNFVPVLALRRIREVVEAENPEGVSQITGI
ncbi:MAG: hypothetical protein ACJ789_10555 [Thermomicrobiales bacterium]